MPQGKGTYGSQVGRPKKKGPIKDFFKKIRKNKEERTYKRKLKQQRRQARFDAYSKSQPQHPMFKYLP